MKVRKWKIQAHRRVCQGDKRLLFLEIISPLKYAFNPCPSGSSQALAKNGAQCNELSTLPILKGNFSLNCGDNRTIS